MKVAILGVWHVHAPDYTRCALEQGEVVGFFERDDGLAAGFSSAFPMLNRYATLEDLLAGEAEGVIVCSATCDHTADIIAAARAGKHIFTEKVLTLTDEEADRIAEVVAESGVTFVISLFQKYIGSHKTVKAVTESGELGKINYIRFRNCHSGSSCNWLPPHFYHAHQCGGGAMIDLGAHGMYLIDWIMGVPTTAVSAFTRACERTDVAEKNTDGVEDNAVTVFTYPNGAIAINETGFVSDCESFVLEVHGERGYVRMEGGRIVKCTNATGGQPVEVPAEAGDPAPIQQFLTGNILPGCGMKEARALTHLMVMAYGKH
ncbi:MAG: Gfo/Idh/MocA family oxidoreductase [Ruminococcaceae bacterium]|nr:Gfo/Idh/MocA family oxidoreductase [Oscillospiraceae bacterium]